MCCGIGHVNRVSFLNVFVSFRNGLFWWNADCSIPRFYEDDPDKFDLDGAITSLAGLGIGLLATAAVSLSKNLADLSIAGSQVIRQAFRLAIVVDEVSQNLQPRDSNDAGSKPDSWAYVLPEVTAEEVQQQLDALYAKEKTPETSKIFISAISNTAPSVTVSGPPARLQALFRRFDFFRDRRHVQLPVYGGMCHASHVYKKDHVQRVVRTSSMELLDTLLSPRVGVHSPSTGALYPARTATELFEHIIAEIMTKSIQWDNVVEAVYRRATQLEASHCDIVVFRISLPAHDLSAMLGTKLPALETHTEELVPGLHEKVKTLPIAAGPRTPMQSKIAIVGMSCRMPGGASSTEKFWDLLERGLDVHRRIPADRFDVDSHYDPTGKRMNTSQTPYGCFIDEPGLFDAPFFNMSPREAQQTDPMQRLGLVTAYEALERAGMGNPHRPSYL